jgi:hypothetical protein
MPIPSKDIIEANKEVQDSSSTFIDTIVRDDGETWTNDNGIAT